MRLQSEPLIGNLKAFVAFARKRVGDPHIAEDLVQESLLKALKADRVPVRDEDVITWFYRILRRSIIDLYRRQDTRERALKRLQMHFPEQPDPSAERALCQCFKSLLPALPPQYRELLEKIDVQGMPLKKAAEQLGEAPNNIAVRLHRARQKLRREVERTCRTCSKHGCLDCSCDSQPALDGESKERAGFKRYAPVRP